MADRQTILGIDIGSISISLALIDYNKKILKTEYFVHNGNINETIIENLNNFDLSTINRIAATSSAESFVLHNRAYNSRISFITSAKHFYENMGSLLIVGGEKYGLALFDKNGEYLNYRSNSSCAAGTGGFLDQQSRRLNLADIQEFDNISSCNRGNIPKIASRCSVFAKTDLIHAQQEGYSLEEICDGLSFGLANNIYDTLFTNTSPNLPLVFAGGVSKNKTVTGHLSNMLGTDIIVHEKSHLFGSIGAAMNLVDDLRKNTINNINKLKIKNAEDVITQKKETKKFYYPPLNLKLSSYPDFSSNEKYEFNSRIYKKTKPVEADIYCDFNNGETYNVYLGIDIGSTSTKAVILNSNRDVLAGFYTRTSGRPINAVQIIFESITDYKEKNNISFNFLGVGTTGSGRKFIEKVISADIALDEITAHAKAAYELDKDVDTIIEIGGQDSKFTTLRNGMVTFSIMNNVCAAGTGSFIEEQAKMLNVQLNEYSGKAVNASAPMSSDRCTVFMERDLNYYLSDGYKVNEILASVLHSVRENYLKKVAIENNIGNKIFFQGATAKNRALVAAFEQRLGKKIMVSKYCHLTGAMGVALNLLDSRHKKTGFRGLDIYKNEIPVSTEICEICANHCKIKKAVIGNDTAAFGFLCGRDYDTKKYINKTSEISITKRYNQVFNSNSKNKQDNEITIGIPAALYLFEEMPLWKKFFESLSMKVVSSENYKDGINEGKQLAHAEFCAPIISMHGHVNYLTDKVDHVFLPVYLELKSSIKEKRRQYCYYTQYAPSIISINNKINKNDNILSPLLRTLIGEFHTKYQLYKMVSKIAKNRFNFLQISSAYDNAYKYYTESINILKKIYKKESKNRNDISVVFVGRGYTILNPTMNNMIPEIFSKHGIKTYSQDMLTYSQADLKEIDHILKALHWNYAAKIIEVTGVVAKTSGVYPVFITSFKCSPDSFVIDYFKKIMDEQKKPYLILQLDDHNSNVGYETRIEAGIRAFRNHYSNKNTEEKKNIIENETRVIKDFSKIYGKTLLFPNWDNILSKFLTAALRKEGIDAKPLEETNETIQKCLSLNTGQCIPMSAIAQGSIDYINKYNLKHEDTVIWNIKSSMSCNIRMFPYYIKEVLNSLKNGFEKVSVFSGEITFIDLSLTASINIYFVYMFSGNLRKLGCKIRPYEKIKGSTDAAINQSTDILEEAFLNNTSKEEALEKVLDLFKKIEVNKTSRPKVAIFGDLYARDNEVMNQNLIKTIEENGGEVLTTSYNQYMKIIFNPYIKKWLKEGLYTQVVKVKIIQKVIHLLEGKYQKMFNRILNEPEYKYVTHPEKILSKLNVKIEHTGESMDNILKIFHLIENDPDISLFVQTNPSYCCPSLITEAMAEKLESLTGIPIVTIEYDGTGGPKNDDIIPYLKYPRKKPDLSVEKAV